MQVPGVVVGAEPRTRRPPKITDLALSFAAAHELGLAYGQIGKPDTTILKLQRPGTSELHSMQHTL